MIPPDVLLVRAISAAERAELQIVAGRYTDASDSIAEVIDHIKSALSVRPS